MIAIISDVHGNYPALKAVLHDIDSNGCERILSLGDVVGYYCMINECIDELKNRNIINLMGNHDAYLLGQGQCPRSMTVNKCIEYQKGIISRENLDYLRNSLIVFEDEILSARHGGWNDPIDEYIDEFNFFDVSDIEKSLFCSGHTHIQKIQKSGEKIYFNPGAVGQPRDGNSDAAYAIIDNGKVRLCRIKYDIDEIADAMRTEGFEDRISECLYRGDKVRVYKA